MDSPYSRLFGTQPDYSMLRVLGCRCFPYLGDDAKDKLDARSLPCVFMGYSNKYKGCRCLYPPTGREYISRPVEFDESTLPYHNPAPLYQNDKIEEDITTFMGWVQSPSISLSNSLSSIGSGGSQPPSTSGHVQIHDVPVDTPTGNSPLIHDPTIGHEHDMCLWILHMSFMLRRPRQLYHWIHLHKIIR